MNKISSMPMVLSVLLIAGCATYDPYTGEEGTSKATSGSIIGALAGAAIGAATSSKGDRGKGVLIGAAAGAAVGGGAGYYMDQQESKLRHQLEGTGVRVKRNGDEIILIMPGNITFETNKYDLRPQFNETLHSIALVLKEFDETAIEIAGYTDSTGSQTYNQTLSEKRAERVKSQLSAEGIAIGRLHSNGYGSRNPVTDNNTKEGRAKNRRVEMKLLPLTN